MNEVELHDSMREYFESKLKQTMEGRFMKEGYILPDTVQVVDMSAGTVVSESLQCDLSYTLMVEADVIRPQPGDRIKGKIQDKNKLGIRMIEGPLDIILAFVHHKDQDAIQQKEIGDEIEVVIAACKYQIGDERQSVIAIWKEDENAAEYLV